MDADFWLQRWHAGQTGFHQSRVMPLLQKYWGGLALPAASRVLVPLAGKSLDVAWLAAQGHNVLAVELSPLAVEQFFAEQGLRPQVRDSAMGRHYAAGNIEFLCGDIFDVDAATLAQCAGFYDRAALIALTPELRRRYVQHVYGQMAEGCRGLLLTLEYKQEQMDGPPFAVPESEVRERYAEARGWDVQVLSRRAILDKEPKFAARGLDNLDTVVYRMERKPG